MRQEAEGHILDTYSAKARGTRRTRWAGQARLSIKSIVARRPRRTLQRGHKPQDESLDFTLEVLTDCQRVTRPKHQTLSLVLTNGPSSVEANEHCVTPELSITP